MSETLQRAELLFEQRRWDDALKACQEHLTLHPEDAHAHCLAARCCVNMELFGFASEYADSAVAASPDDPYGHYIRSFVNYARNLDEEAHQEIDIALGLDPTNPDYHVMKGRLYMKRSEWLKAHDAVDTALGFDPVHEDARVVKAGALARLRKYEEARSELMSVLEQSPENDEAYIELGNLNLYLGEWRTALEHFEQALAIDPESEAARAGFMEALRAQYPLYGILLRYFLWLNRYSKEYQQAIQYSLSVAVRLLGAIKREFPFLAPIIGLVLLVWRIFSYLSWTIRAGTTLLLRLNKYGRKLVDQDEVLESNLVGACWGAALVCWLYHLFIDPFTMVCRIGMPVFLTLPMLIGGAFSMKLNAWPKYVARGVLVVEGFCAVVGMLLLLVGHDHAFTLLRFYAQTLGIAVFLMAILESVEVARE